MKNLSKLLVAVVMLVVLSVNVFTLTDLSVARMKPVDGDGSEGGGGGSCSAAVYCASGTSAHCSGNFSCTSSGNCVECRNTDKTVNRACCY